MTAVQEDFNHGTLTGYQDRRCRCSMCRARYNEYVTARREKDGLKTGRYRIRLTGEQVRILIACPNQGCKIDLKRERFALCPDHRHI